MSKPKLKDIIQSAREYLEDNDSDEGGKEVIENLLEWLDEISDKISESK